MAERLTLALPKGRIAQQAVPLLARAGIDLAPFLADQADRRLMFDLADDTRVLLVKPSDVPTYVEHGIADLGIAGRDTLLEEARDLYEPLDLGIGRCRMAIAEPRDRPARLQRGAVLRVATKYPRIATRHYRERGLQPEVIPLAGSIELAAVTGLADQIVDLVESGETLRQNGLVVVETICEITSRLVVHPASLKLEGPRISRIVDALANAVASEGRAAS